MGKSDEGQPAVGAGTSKMFVKVMQEVLKELDAAVFWLRKKSRYQVR
jgi:hypothetical protein